MILQENVPLAPFTTFGVGGPARYFIPAASPQDVREAVSFSGERNEPLFVLGGGSNLLISDAGWPGVVLRVEIAGVERRGAGRYFVGAGENWDAFVAAVVADNCAGIECLSGIPGTVGGTPIQNVGAYGQEVASSIVAVQAFDLTTKSLVEIPNADCGFKYRSSIFNSSAAGRFIVLGVEYQLTPGGAPAIEYADLQARFSAGTTPRLAEVRHAVREIRARKGMLIDPDDPDSRSAGSFFKNPVISLDHYNDLASRPESRDMPHWWGGLNRVKLSAAWLVEHAGFAKGTRRGNAAVSRKHSLALVNAGGASATEIARLAAEIVAGVQARFGVELQREPLYVGEFARSEPPAVADAWKT